MRGPPPAGRTLPRVSANAFAGPSPTDTSLNRGPVHKKKAQLEPRKKKGPKERVERQSRPGRAKEEAKLRKKREKKKKNKNKRAKTAKEGDTPAE